MKVNYLGHASFLFHIAGKKVLIDPFISPNELAAHIDIDKIECDFILVTHGHGDHIADLVPIAKRTSAKVISSYEMIEWCGKQGISNGHPMNLGGSWNFDFGTVKMVYAQHSNSLPDGSYGGPASGFVIKAEGKSIYFAGDTALNQEMKLIGDYIKPDIAFLPIGDNFTMGVDDALIAADFIKCKNIIGMHYDTFGYIKIDHEKAIQSFSKIEAKLHLLKISVDDNDAIEL